ncbi:MAG: hypothetical protein HY073_00310 [Deltaproteobacteria bacterium]|nr:hypothetical protein [Deltaproteobacteria bacterium]
MIAQQELEQLRSRVDIVQVIGERIPLKKSGANFKGLCPFHAEKSPSFMVHPEKQIFRCFGCGAGGDVFSFLMKYEGVEFIEAVEQLAERFGIVLTKSGQDAQEFKKNKTEKELFWKLNRLACRFYYQMLQNEGGKKEGPDGCGGEVGPYSEKYRWGLF